MATMRQLRDHRELLFEEEDEEEEDKEGDIFKHNIKMLYGSDDYNNFMTRFKYSKRKIVKAALKEIRLLSQVKILKKLGSGIQKIGYLLNNDHVLVFATNYVEGFASTPEGHGPLDTLRSIQDRMFAGKGSKHDVMVYDVGEVDEDEVKFWWAELSQVIPLEIYYSMFNVSTNGSKTIATEALPNVSDKVFEELRRMMVKKEVPEKNFNKHDNEVLPDGTLGYNIYYYAKMLKSKPTKKQVLQATQTNEVKKTLRQVARKGHPKSIIIGYLKAVMHVAMTYGISAATDAHTMNVGVSITNPNHVVMYDIT